MICGEFNKSHPCLFICLFSLDLLNKLKNEGRGEGRLRQVKMEISHLLLTKLVMKDVA